MNGTSTGSAPCLTKSFPTSSLSFQPSTQPAPPS
ncbi:hypothetical protein LINPERHAP2_LOCUS95 [Linum perenne]